MPWDANATIQLIGVLISILGIGMACYNHKRIIAASQWLYTKACCSRRQKPGDEGKGAFELFHVQPWDDPNVEAGAATSAWAEELSKEMGRCCG